MHVVATCLGLLLVVHLLARSLTFVSLAFLTVEVLVFLGWQQAPVGSKRQQQSRRVDVAAVQPCLLHWDREPGCTWHGKRGCAEPSSWRLGEV